MNPTLVIRTDANAQIGIGHFMRCRALAEAWPGTVHFVGSAPKSSKVLQSPPGSEQDALELLAFADEVKAACVVIDGYQFRVDYQKLVKEKYKLLVIDDCGDAGPYQADFILNQNLGARAEWYVGAGKLLLGSRYVLLRKRYWRWRKSKRAVPDQAKNIIITMGGSDPDNVTWQIMQALETKATVVIGPANPHRAILQTSAKHRTVIDPFDFEALLAASDFAFCAGGTTCWEMCFLGVPFMVSVLADNQRNNAENLIQSGIAEKFDVAKIASLLADPVRRAEMSQKGRALIDGEGADRVVQQLTSERIRVRLAREEDSRLLWEWANDPETRAVSFSSDPIPWEVHQQWFAGKMQDLYCAFYIGVDAADHPVGQIRFERESVSVSLDKKFRGQGLGADLIRLGVRRVFKERNFPTLHALIKPANAASIRAFEYCGFTKAGEETVAGHSALHFILNRK